MKIFKFTFPEWAGELEKFLFECKVSVDQLVYEALQHVHNEAIDFCRSATVGVARELGKMFRREMEETNDRLRLLEQRVEQLELQRTSVIAAKVLDRARTPVQIVSLPRPEARHIIRPRRPETVLEREMRLDAERAAQVQ